MRTRIALLITVLFLLLIPAYGAVAQGANPACKPGDVITKASKLKATGSSKVDMIALYTLAQDITNMDIACNGMVFKGHGNKVLNPITLPAALYKVTAKTQGAIALKARSLPGSNCDANAEILILNDINPNFQGDQSLNSESTLPVEGDCRVVLSVENNRADWVITFLPIQ